MTCSCCEKRVEQALLKVPGVGFAQARYQDGSVEVEITESTSLDACRAALAAANYPLVEAGEKVVRRRILTIALAIIAAIVGFLVLQGTSVFNIFPAVSTQMTLPLLFLTGVATSVHCVAMCGGIAISQTTRIKPAANAAAAGSVQQVRRMPLTTLKPGLLYNLGRVISYTLIGGLVGALGSVIALTIEIRALLLLIAALFMLVMGLTLLGAFTPLRALVPQLPRSVGERLGGLTQGRGPLVVGFLNGFLPCGPLQTMQLYALTTGSFIMGALSMLAFSLGTAPLLFVLGALNSLLNQRFARAMTMVSATLVLMLGLSMLANSLSLFGIVIPL
jgi:sulfite exporter TauE/SafE/copper chaperone CopZ